MHVGCTPRYPICFLTNGGGITEQQKADELSSWLGVQVKENQARTHGPRCWWNFLSEVSIIIKSSVASKVSQYILTCPFTCPVAHDSSTP